VDINDPDEMVGYDQMVYFWAGRWAGRLNIQWQKDRVLNKTNEVALAADAIAATHFGDTGGTSVTLLDAGTRGNTWPQTHQTRPPMTA